MVVIGGGEGCRVVELVVVMGGRGRTEVAGDVGGDGGGDGGGRWWRRCW